MEIKYNQKNVKFWLFIGIAFLVIGFLGFIFGTQLQYFPWIMGVVYLTLGLRRKYRNYVTITDSEIKKDFSKPIPIADITHVHYFGGDYTLTTPNRKLTLTCDLIDPWEKPKLDEFLQNLKAKLVS